MRLTRSRSRTSWPLRQQCTQVVGPQFCTASGTDTAEVSSFYPIVLARAWRQSPRADGRAKLPPCAAYDHYPLLGLRALEGIAPLRMDDHWLRNFKGNPGLRQLRLEYETLNWKKNEMMRIVERIKQLKPPVRSEGGSTGYEGYLIAEDVALAEWTWKGASELGGCTWDHHGTGDQVEFAVVTNTWKFVESKKQPSRKCKEDRESTQK